MGRKIYTTMFRDGHGKPDWPGDPVMSFTSKDAAVEYSVDYSMSEGFITTDDVEDMNYQLSKIGNYYIKDCDIYVVIAENELCDW